MVKTKTKEDTQEPITFIEVEKELTGLYSTRPSFEQGYQIRLIKQEYQEKAAALVIEYMQKEIAVLKNAKLKLTI